MRVQLSLFACLAFIAGVQAAPVPGLLGNLLQPSSISARPSDSTSLIPLPVVSPGSGGLLESNTGTTLSALLKQYNVVVPEGLNKTLDGIKLSGINEIALSQFLRLILGGQGVRLPTGKNIESVIQQIIVQYKNGLHGPATTSSGNNDFLTNFLNAYKPQNNQDHLLKDLNDIFTEPAYHTSSREQPTPTVSFKSGNLPDVYLPPVANVKPSLTVALLPSGSNKGVVGVANVDVSAALNVEGAKFTLAPKIHV